MQPELEPYLDDLRRQGHLVKADLQELEDHLITAYEEALGRGLEEAEALVLACHNLGPARVLGPEFRKLNAMNPIARLAGLLVVLATISLVAGPGSGWMNLLHLPSLFMVVGVVLGGLLASFGPASLVRTLRQAFERNPLPDRDTQTALRVAEHGRRLSWCSGILGVLVGSILVLSNLADPSALAPALATCLLSLFYGALVAELGFSNLTQWLRTSPSDCDSPGDLGPNGLESSGL